MLEQRVCVIGMGYVGLPLALALARVQSQPVLGFDIDTQRISALQAGHDYTGFAERQTLLDSGVAFSADASQLGNYQVFIVTVPTPVTEQKLPDLTPLQSACTMLAKAIKPGALIVFESTVYPGCTEEVCVPLLEAGSGLRYNRDFYLGYSPERINPGDRVHTLETIVKVTSGSTPEAAERVADLYRALVPAGIFQAASIATAEAAKVLENVQRDVNIALINEFAQICHHLKLDSADVLAAARSKWNFLDFRPGLVGGHCIGVDPYYLIHRARRQGFDPRLITTARMVNEGMSAHVVGEVLKLCALNGIVPAKAHVLICGITFKENCVDVRNSRVFDIATQFRAFGADIQMWDPLVAEHLGTRVHVPDVGEVQLWELNNSDRFDVIILAVAHQQIKALGGAFFRQRLRGKGVLYDVKGALPAAESDGRL